MTVSDFDALFQTNPEVAQALSRLVAGDAKEEDRSLVARWEQEDPGRETLRAELVSAWEIGATVPLPDEVDGHWMALQSMLEEPIVAPVQPAPVKIPAFRTSRYPEKKRFMGMPRVAMMAVGAAAAMALAVKFPDLTNIFGHAESMREYTTARAQRMTVALPDGTQAILAPATTLRYLASGNGARLVELQGQAYFTVQHDTERPFSVIANGVTTRVLGTAFAVRAYGDDKHAEVAVAEGKVGVGETAILLAGDVAHARSEREVDVTRDAKMLDVLGWTSGRLAFRDTRLSDIVADLERAYDLDIRLADSALAARHVTLDLTNEPADRVLHTIALVTGSVYTQTGRAVVFASAR